MTVTINGTTGIANDGGYTGDGVVFADTTPANTLVTTTSGNVGIGTSSPAAKLHVVSDATTTALIQSSAAATTLAINNTNASAWGSNLAIRTGGVDAGYFGTIGSLLGSTSQDLTVYATAGNGFRVYTNGNNERARIDSSGNLLVGTTSQVASALITNNGSYSQNGNQMNFASGSSTIEFVNRSTGAKTFSWYYGSAGGGSPATLSTSGVWTNASDARGKENITDIGYGLNTVLSMQARQYDVNSDESHAIGFIAQELLPIIPEVVHVTRTDEHGDDWYGVDYGSIAAVLVKAIQEQQAIITALTARVTALDARLTSLEGA